MTPKQKELEAFRDHFGKCMVECSQCHEFHHKAYCCTSCGFDASLPEAEQVQLRNGRWKQAG